MRNKDLPLIDKARIYWNSHKSASPFCKVPSPWSVHEGMHRIKGTAPEGYVAIRSLTGQVHIFHEN